jgi:formylglycine-generating enzyme required for sulfatase activity
VADIFLSYAREDLETAKNVAVALEKEGWSVWWDRSKILPGDDINEIIKVAIAEAKCLIVIWSPAATISNWVIGEANIGLRRKILVQIHIGEFDPPINFQPIHAEDFSTWQGEADKPEFKKLRESVRGRVGDSRPKPIEPEMVVIVAGSFQMGGTDDDEKPIHTVTFSKPFALGKYPVTFSEYDVFLNHTGRENPRDEGWGRKRRPLIDVNWHEAHEYSTWLSQISGKAYRLPSEAEWEYTCRAGSQSEFFWGDDDSLAHEYAWCAKFKNGKTYPVGEKRANPWGLHDMTGNVWEWVEDTWHADYQGAPSDGSAWGGGDMHLCVLRGGSWGDETNSLRSAYRYWARKIYRYNNVGFRLALDLP